MTVKCKYKSVNYRPPPSFYTKLPGRNIAPVIYSVRVRVEKNRACGAYPLIHTKLRTVITETRLQKLIYIYHNMRLSAPSALMESVSLESFALGLLNEHEAERAARERAGIPAQSEKGNTRAIRYDTIAHSKRHRRVV